MKREWFAPLDSPMGQHQREVVAWTIAAMLIAAAIVTDTPQREVFTTVGLLLDALGAYYVATTIGAWEVTKPEKNIIGISSLILLLSGFALQIAGQWIHLFK